MTLTQIIFSILLSCLSIGISVLFLLAFYRQAFTRALWLKGIASFCFVAVGTISCFSGELNSTKLLIFLGLCLGLIGDEAIALCQVFPRKDHLAFVSGGAFFIAGHFLYIVALFLLGTPGWLALALAFGIVILASVLHNRRRAFLSGPMKLPLAIYLSVVIFMGATAIGLFAKRLTLGTALFSLGGLLFAISDNLLFSYKLGNRKKFSQNVYLHITYYLAQLSIAWSLTCL